MRVLYLTWGEVPRMSSVYGGQVVDVVRRLQRQPGLERVDLLAGVPLIHSGLVREKWRYPQEIARIRAAIGADHFSRRTIATPPVGVHPTRRQLPFFTQGHVGFLARKIRQQGYDVVQCRSYVATHLALRARAEHGLNVKVVFDSRSYMPDEAILLGRWAEGSDDHRFWLDRQAQMLAEADCTNVVSETMKRRFDSLGARRCELIYLNVEQEAAAAGSGTAPPADAPMLVYAGYLSETGWHSPASLWRVFDQVRRHSPAARLRVITKSPHPTLRQSLTEGGWDHLQEAIEMTSAPSPREVVRMLADATAGVLSYRTPQGELEHVLAEGVFATKTAEYLMAGLPVLVNRVCGGAAAYVRSHDSGVDYDEAAGLQADDVARLIALRRQSARIADEAVSHFSSTRNAERMAAIYASL